MGDMEDKSDIQASDIKPEGWKNTPTLKDFKQDFLDSQAAHDAQVTKIKNWLDYFHVTGKAKPNTPEGYSEAQPKLIRKQAEWRYAALSEPFLATDHLFTVKPNTWEDTEPARQNALVLNKQFNVDIDKVAFIDNYIRAAEDEGTVIVKVCWKFEEDEVEVEKPIIEYTEDPAFGPLLQELVAQRELDPTGFNAQVIGV